MSLKTTLWLLVVVAALAGLLFIFKPAATNFPEDSIKHLIEDLPEGGAKRLELSLVTQQMLSLEQRGDTWWLVEPIEDRADRGVMQQLHEVLMGNPRYEVDPNPALDILKALRLEPPRARVTLRDASGGALALRVGERDATGAFVHVMFEGDDTLYRTGSNLSNVLERPLREFRDRKFLRGDGALLRRIEIHHPSEPPIVLERPGTDWMLTEPRKFPAHHTAVNEIKALLLLEVDSFQETDPDDQQRQKAGLDDGVATKVVFDWGERKVEALFAPFGPDAPAPIRLAWDSERNHIVAVSGRALLALRHESKQYRDANVCSVAMANVQWLRLRLRGRPVLEVKYNPLTRQFEFVEPFDQQHVDDSRTGAFHAWLRRVSRMGATDFLDQEELPPADPGQDPWAVLGFDRPRATLEFRLVDSSGVTSKLAIEAADPDGSGTVPVRRLGQFSGTAYLVPERIMEKVLEVDPREFLARDLFPGNILEIKEAGIRAGERRRSLVRNPLEGAEYWKDPQDEERKTTGFQEYLSALPEAKVLEFLPRGPLPEDGLEEPAAQLTLMIEDRDGRHELRVDLGAKDPSGKTVLAQAAPDLPPRTVFRLDAWVLDDLLKLLEQ